MAKFLKIYSVRHDHMEELTQSSSNWLFNWSGYAT